MNRPAHIAVVGGGITGLSAAHQLSGLQIGDRRPRVTLLEASDRLGGKIRSESFAGTTVEFGPEALLIAPPTALALCQQLGLADELVSPLQASTTVWTRGRLRELPPGVLSGLPNGIGPILRSGILSPAGAVRAGADLLLPSSNGHADQSVGALVRRRLGSQALERMIDPLLGGIYAGDPDRLSVRATAPKLDLLAREHRSLIRGLMLAGKQSTPARGPMFMTLPGGLQRLVAGLQRKLTEVELRCNESVERLTPLPDGRYQLDTSAGRGLHADGVILAVPAFAAQTLLADSVPAAAEELRGFQYASVAVVWLSFPATAVPKLPTGTGFLVPRVERRTLSACTWASAKWPHLAHPNRVLLRCSVGRGQPQATSLDDHALVNAAIDDLQEAIGVSERPLETRVARWDRAMPQYTVGHLDRIDRLETAVAGLPHLTVAGAAYRGMGVPQCIAQGQDAAARIASGPWP